MTTRAFLNSNLIAGLVVSFLCGALLAEDCNQNDIPDDFEIFSGFAEDCNENGVPDECDIAPLFGGLEVTATNPAMTPLALSQGDLTGDAHSELIVVNWGTCCSYPDSFVSIQSYMENGLFEEYSSFSISNESRGVTAGNFDDDQVLDLAIASTENDTATVHFNDGTGEFSTFVTLSLPANAAPRSIVAADLNGDGYDDLATANNVTDNVSVLLNHGDGSFMASVNYSTGDSPYAITSGDWDVDDDIDLAVAVFNASQVEVLWNDGSGSFPVQTELGVGIGPRGVTRIDANGDSIPDLAAAHAANSPDPGGVTVLLSNGDGTFQAGVEFSAGDYPFAIHAADLENDGDDDLVVTNDPYDPEDGTPGVAVLLNDGLGAYSEPLVYVVNDDPESLAVADWDEDGYSDVAVAHANSTDSSVTVLLNLTPAVVSDDIDGNGVPDECEVPTECEGDANGDGEVDPLDSGFVLARFGCKVGAGDDTCDAADQNGDGAVDPLDVGFVLARFGTCP